MQPEPKKLAYEALGYHARSDSHDKKQVEIGHDIAIPTSALASIKSGPSEPSSFRVASPYIV